MTPPAIAPTFETFWLDEAEIGEAEDVITEADGAGNADSESVVLAVCWGTAVESSGLGSSTRMGFAFTREKILDSPAVAFASAKFASNLSPT